MPVIDFQYMRQRVGVGPTGDILDIISSWPAEEQQRAHQAILEIEEQALRDMQVRAFVNQLYLPVGMSQSGWQKAAGAECMQMTQKLQLPPPIATHSRSTPLRQ